MNSVSIEYGDTGEFMASLGRECTSLGSERGDEPTDRVSLRLLPSLDEVEAVLDDQEIPGAVRVAYYDPQADVREPWLWLEPGNPGWGPLRIYHGAGPAELKKIVDRFGRWYR